MSFNQKISNLDEEIAKFEIKKRKAIDEALKSNNADDIYKAQNYLNGFIGKEIRRVESQNKGKSILIDPFDNNASLGYYDRPSRITFDVLRNMAKTPIIRAIIDTRKEMVAEYTKPQPDKFSKGFVIRRVKKSQEEEGGTVPDADKKIIEQLTSFLLNCGEKDNGRLNESKVDWIRDDFETFIRKIVEDSLVLDQANFEIVPTKLGDPHNFYGVDGTTIRIADSFDNQKDPGGLSKVNGYYPAYAQVYDGIITAEYYPWELCFGVRNPQTSIYKHGYGRSELEDMIQIVTSLLNSDDYNAKFFRNGSTPRGALVIKDGNASPDKIDQLKREWNAMMSGNVGAHKTPILDGEKMEWLDFHINNKDMEYKEWSEYLIKLACAMYKISPEEVGFPIEGTGSGGLGKGDRSEEKQYSQDKGLKPLLRSIQTWINKFIIGPKSNNEFEFLFVGLNAETSRDEEDRLTRAVTLYMTVNEIRNLKGLPPIKGGDKILNPIMIDEASDMSSESTSSVDGEKKHYSDTPENRRLGRVGLPVGDAVKQDAERKADVNELKSFEELLHD